MTIERSAWKGIYRAISEGNLTEKESYDIVFAVFFQPMQYILPQQEEQQQQEPPKPIEVKGFGGDKN